MVRKRKKEIKKLKRKIKKLKKKKIKKRKKKIKKIKKPKRSTSGELVFKVPKKWSKSAYIDKNQYEKKYKLSIKDNEGFWSKEGKRIVGIVKVIKEAFVDKTDKTQKFVSVIVKSTSPLKREVSLQEIKKNENFKDFSLVKQSRLSVMEVDLICWKKICKMGRV